MFGEGISVMDLMGLLNQIRTKELVLHIKVIDGEWQELSKKSFKEMVDAIGAGKIRQADDIRLRLTAKGTQAVSTAPCNR